MKPIRILLCGLVLLGLCLPAPAGSKTQSKVPDYSMVTRDRVPVEYTWRIEDIYPTMDEWKKAKDKLTGMIGKIDEMGKDWTASADKMTAFLDFLSTTRKEASKLFAYVSHQGNADLGNPLFQQLKGQVQVMFVQVGSKLAFMNDDIMELGQEKFAAYVKANPGLKPYAFGIEQVLRMKAHVLPKDQQKIASLTGLFAGAPQKAAKMLNDVEIPPAQITLSDGKKVNLNYANYVNYRDSKNAEDRLLVMHSYWKNHKKFENTLAILLDGAIKQHLFNARIRNFKDCLQARLYGDNMDPQVYYNLVKSVRENRDSLHRYLEIKKELLGVEKNIYEDINAIAVKAVDKKYAWDEAEDIIIGSMKPLGKDYTKGLKIAFSNRWIDRYNNKGKETGAYSGGVYGVHPYIKMNYNGSYSSVSTLTHELGHAMHSFFSHKAQHFANTDYPSFLAEIASTFNENMLVEYLLKTEKDDLFKLYILDRFLDRYRRTVYRQTLFAELELAMHRRVEAGQTLTPEWLNGKYLELTRFYYGHDKGVMEVGDYIQNEWGSIPHFYYNYYVFTYSTGMIASQALAAIVLDGGQKERERYLAFLQAGGSRYPLDILKDAGVDMTTDAPAKAAFKRFDDLVAQMREIMARLKKKGKI